MSTWQLCFFFFPSIIFFLNCLKGCLFQTSGSFGFLPNYVNVILEESGQNRSIDWGHHTLRNGSFTQGSDASDGRLVWNFSIGKPLLGRFPPDLRSGSPLRYRFPYGLSERMLVIFPYLHCHRVIVLVSLPYYHFFTCYKILCCFKDTFAT